MQVFYWFYSCWLNLEENKQNELLVNIFKIDFVAVSSIKVFKNYINFKMYSKGVFYNYFIFNEIGNNFYFVDLDVVLVKIFIENINELNNNYYFIFHLLQCSTEIEVYQLVQKYL